MNEKLYKLEKSRGSYPGQGNAYICHNDAVDFSNKPHALIALHGSGRSAESYRDVTFYRTQRDLALECGYIFASVSNGQDAFGLDNGFYNVRLLYEMLIKEYNIKSHVVLWGSSAGGLMMHRFLREMPGCVDGLLGMFPLFNPLTNPLLDSLKNAYGTADENELFHLLQPFNPENYPLDIYKNILIAIAHGVDDKTVLIDQSRQLKQQILSISGSIELFEGPGGHSTENFALYGTPIFKNTLLKIINE